MPRPRRIFRPSQSPCRRRGPLIIGGAMLLGLGVSGIGLPPDLLGSPPRQEDWSALAAEVRVVDGETLRLGDRTVRLRGLDAPERGETCTDAAGRRFDCGAGAAEALSRLVNGRSVVCVVDGEDRFGHGLGTCSAAGAELNAGLVATGWALAGGAEALHGLEAEARQAARGLWAAGVTRPEGWAGRD